MDGEAIDKVIHKIGDFGKFQIRAYILTCAPIVVIALGVMNIVFIHFTLPYRCALPGLDNDTYHSQGDWHDAMINASIPLDPESLDGLNHCELIVPLNSTSDTNETNAEVKCDRWVYDRSVIVETVQSEFNFVCDNRPMETVAQMASTGGELVGGIFAGYFADRFGRKPVFLISIILDGIFGTAAAFSPERHSFSFLRFMIGFSIGGTFGAGFTLIMELVGTSKRMLAGVLVEYFWIVGAMSTAGFAYLANHWRHLLLVSSVPLFGIIPFFWLIPESPRWLLASTDEKKREQARKLLVRMAEVNGRHLSEKDLELLNASAEDFKRKDEGFVRLFRSPKMLLTLFIVTLNWFSVSIMYGGLSLNSGKLPGNLYVNFLLISAVEIPAYTLLFTIDKFGRKAPHVIYMVVGGLSLLCTVPVDLYAPKDAPSTRWVYVGLNVVGKLGVTAAYGLIVIWAAEVFPTVARSSMFAIAGLVGRCGAMLAPIIVNEARFEGPVGGSIPLVIMGIISVTTGLLAIILPETANVPLPETIEDAENLYSSRRKTAETKVHDGNLFVSVPLDSKEIQECSITSC